MTSRFHKKKMNSKFSPIYNSFETLRDRFVFEESKCCESISRGPAFMFYVAYQYNICENEVLPVYDDAKIIYC